MSKKTQRKLLIIFLVFTIILFPISNAFAENETKLSEGQQLAGASVTQIVYHESELIQEEYDSVLNLFSSVSSFAGGDGSQANPYQITNWHHLNNVRNHLGEHFILMNDLDASSDGYDDLAGSGADSDAGWLPIGTNSLEFTGTFEGNGNTISGLHINRTTADTGLFGVLAEGACNRQVLLNKKQQIILNT